MSQNHPHDNIYSILGKLDALKPTPEQTRADTVKRIYESVEAQSSILSGVDAVQAKLTQQFAESEKWIQKATNPKTKGDLHKALHVAQGEKIPQAKLDKAAHSKNAHLRHMAQFAKNVANEEVTDEGHQLPGKDEYYTLRNNVWTVYDGDEIVHEYRPERGEVVGAKKLLARFDDEGYDVTHVVSPMGVATYLPGMDPRAHPEETNECAMCEDGTCQEASHQAQSTMKHVNASNASPKVKAAIGKATKDMKSGIPGYGDREAAYKAAGIPDTRGPMEETVTKGPDTYGRSYYNDPDFTGATPVKAKNPTGQRGRPKKADSERSAASLPQFGKKFNDPFGRVPGEPPKGKKGVVHSMDESLKTMSTKLSRISEGVNLQAMLREKHQTVEEMLAELSDDMNTFKETGHMSELLRDCMEIKGAHGKMVADEAVQRGDSFAPQFPASPAPQPTFLDKAKAMGKKFMDVVGHPDDDKILDPLKQQVGGNHYNENSELNELARLAGLTVAETVDKDMEEGNKFTKGLEDDDVKVGDKIPGTNAIKTKDIDEADMEEGNKFTKGLEDDDVKVGDKIPGTNAIKTKDIDESSMEECGMEDNSNSNINVSTNMSSNGDKSVTVTANGAEAEALMQMLALAGLGGGARQMSAPVEPQMEVMADEGAEIEVDDAGANPVNAPEEQYYSMRASTMGPGEGDNGEKAMHPDRPTKNNGDNALAKPANEAVIALEAQLAAEYESIKKSIR
jgi:hypothetical protein